MTGISLPGCDRMNVTWPVIFDSDGNAQFNFNVNVSGNLTDVVAGTYTTVANLVVTTSCNFTTAVDCGGGGGITVTDGVNTVTGVTTEKFVGATVSGASPNATITNAMQVATATITQSAYTNSFGNSGSTGLPRCS